jgi:hypothetical protein
LIFEIKPGLPETFSKLFHAAAAHFGESRDDDEDGPRHAYESPCEDAKPRKEKVDAEENDEPRHHAVMRASAPASPGAADFSVMFHILPHFMIFHMKKVLHDL